MQQEPYYPCLEGVIAGDTAISSIGGSLEYRGYAVEELAESATFLEVAYLILQGELPNQEQFADFESMLAEASEVDPVLLGWIQDIPLHVGCMDVLRTGLSAMGHFDAQCDDDTTSAHVAKTLRLLAQLPVLIAVRHRTCRGLERVDSDLDLGYAANLLRLLTGREPTPLAERAMDASLILYAEHEFNASSFAARVVASTRSDLYSGLTAAVGALKGALHGGVSDMIMDLLEDVDAPDDADAWVRQRLERNAVLLGFGHRVYRSGDPRAAVLKQHCARLAEETGNTRLEAVAEAIEQSVWRERELAPNLDWPTARLYHYLGLDVELFRPLFVVSRTVGWAAHFIEQSEQNRLIRPRSRYVGPSGLHFLPISERG